jgi:cytochrome c55X
MLLGSAAQHLDTDRCCSSSGAWRHSLLKRKNEQMRESRIPRPNAPSAADLKFLQRQRPIRKGTSNRKAALEHILASAPLLPKFVSEGAAMYHELRKRGTSALAIAIALTLAGGSAFAGDDPDAGKLTNLVRHDCGSCHGLSLKGGLGKPLTADRLLQWDGDQLTQIILDGIPGTPMAPWRPLLSEAEARWIAEALKSGNLQ